MTIFLIILGIALITIGTARTRSKKKATPAKPAKPNAPKSPQELVTIISKTEGNTTTMTINLNAEEYMRRAANGALPKSEKKKDATDIAGFYGQQHKSPNGHYTVVSADSYERNGKMKHGQLALIENEQLLYQVNLQRPNDAHVSNNGIVICCDWLSSDALTGKFLIFSVTGELIFDRRTTANLGNCAISDNGLFALFETYGSDTGHSNQIFTVDVTERKIIKHFDRQFSFRWAIIDEENQSITLKNNQNFTYKLNFNGDHLNRADYEHQVLIKGSVTEKLRLYYEKSDEENFSNPQFLQLLEKAINDKGASYVYGVDRIYRRIGEYHEGNNQPEQAIVYWEKAIAINPKVGIAKKLEALKKKIG